MDVGLNGIPAYLIGISTHLILVYALFRQWFRFSTQATLLGAAALKIMELCADEFMTDDAAYPVRFPACWNTAAYSADEKRHAQTDADYIYDLCVHI